MLYNHELIKKLRYAAFGTSAFMLGYAILTFLDNNIHTLRLIIIILCLAIASVAAWFLKKPGKKELIAYGASMLLVVILLMFRIRANLALDISLFGLIAGITAGFGYQLKKLDGFIS
jgi:hypothetical protein